MKAFKKHQKPKLKNRQSGGIAVETDALFMQVLEEDIQIANAESKQKSKIGDSGTICRAICDDPVLVRAVKGMGKEETNANSRGNVSSTNIGESARPLSLESTCIFSIREADFLAEENAAEKCADPRERQSAMRDYNEEIQRENLYFRKDLQYQTEELSVGDAADYKFSFDNYFTHDGGKTYYSRDPEFVGRIEKARQYNCYRACPYCQCVLNDKKQFEKCSKRVGGCGKILPPLSVLLDTGKGILQKLQTVQPSSPAGSKLFHGYYIFMISHGLPRKEELQNTTSALGAIFQSDIDERTNLVITALPYRNTCRIIKRYNVLQRSMQSIEHGIRSPMFLWKAINAGKVPKSGEFVVLAN